MNVDLHIPRRGDRVSAAYMARILAEIRANRILPSPGTRISRGPHGTHISVEIPKRASASAADKGCWRISAETVSEDGASVTYHKLEDRYYRIGGRIFESPDQTTLEELVAAGNVWVCAEIRYDSQENAGVAIIRGFGSFAEMETASKARMASLIPLYKLKAKESEDSAPTVHVELDMRTMPNVQEFEWGLE